VPILILVVCALALYIDFWPGARFAVLSNIDAGVNSPLGTKLGLDLRGGYSVTYQALPRTNSDGTVVYPGSSDMQTIQSIIENRVNSTGAGETVVEIQGDNQIVVEVPGATNPEQIKALVGQSGQLTFIPLDRTTYGYMDTTKDPNNPTQVPGTSTIPSFGTDISGGNYGTPLFGGDQVDGSQVDARLDTTKTPAEWVVDLALKSTASAAFATWSQANVGSYFMIVLDGKVQQTPYIQEAITNGKAVISGGFTADSAKQLATVLQYGALPFSLGLLTQTDIPATLGQTFMDQTLFGGAIGICLVLVFMLIYYRLPGVVACLALTYYGVAVLALFRIVPVTLTLAGIAGFVLSVGMAVDANILIFERTKEELRSGKTLVSAMEAGFNRALNSIIDSNVSTLITATILYFGGSATVKGFALVLIIGVLTSMFTAVVVSRRLLRLVVHQEFAQHAWMYGVSDEEFKARAVRMGRREARGRV
jgi:preprotein translocase subunit SecD